MRTLTNENGRYIMKLNDSFVNLLVGRYLERCLERCTFYGICISHSVRFARCCTCVLDFHCKNLQTTSKLFDHGYRYQKFPKTFKKFIRSYSELKSSEYDLMNFLNVFGNF